MPPQVSALVNGNQVITYQFQIQWENSGSTPTRDALQHVSYFYDPGGLPDNFPYADLGDLNNIRAVFGPRQTLGSGLMTLPVHVIKQVQNKTTRLFFYRWTAYRDEFEHTPIHVTEFCSELAGINGPDISVKGEPPHNGCTPIVAITIA